MKKTSLIFLSFLLPILISAQDYYKKGSFVIRGQVKNSASELIKYQISEYLGSFSSSLVINADGSFEQHIPVQHRQDLFIVLNDSLPVVLSVQDQDTITLNWDQKDIKKSLVVRGANEGRTKELQIQMELEADYLLQNVNLNQKIYEERKTLTAEAKFNLINQQFNRHIKAVQEKNGIIAGGLRYYITGLYFKYSSLLQSFGLIPEFKLHWDTEMHDISPALNDKRMGINYKILNENWFWNIADYRNFIYDYVRFYTPFQGYSPETGSQLSPFTATLDEYNRVTANINIINIREWFITKTIMDGFRWYEFKEVKNVYDLFIVSCKPSYLKDTLQQYHDAITRLKPGNPAPAFTLKNEKGETISLNDLKGKVLYIDFWGVYCAPCIAEIESHVPALHERYKNEMVAFVYICVDAKESIWKNALRKYPLKGINLLAEGWANNPVCKEYNIQGVPHYVLIDKNGKIVNNNAPAPSMLDLKSGNNPIDRLLK